MKIDDLLDLGLDAESAGVIWEKIAEMKKGYADKIAELKSEIDKVKIEYAVQSALEKAGVYSEKAVLALINFENIKVENGVVVGVEKEIERVRNECGILFAGGEVPRVISVASGENGDSVSLVRDAMGI